MDWRRTIRRWGPIAVALGACGGAILIYVGAWHAGCEANAFTLLGCKFVSVPLLLFSWWPVAATVTDLARPGPRTAGGLRAFEVAGTCLAFSGCCGCYPIWPVVVGLLTVLVIASLVHARKDTTRSPEEGSVRAAVLRVGVAAVLFAVTWYLCATTTQQARRGFRERVESLGGPERLQTWAAGVIAAHKNAEYPATILTPEEVPDFVNDLMGPTFQGVRDVRIEGTGDDRSVAIRVGGSAYHFRLDVYPSPSNRTALPWWLGGDSALWPGIDLDTEGK